MRHLRALIAVVLALAWAPIVQAQAPLPPPPSPLLRVHFVDVGQGDGVLIQTPAGNVVYDAGENPERMREIPHVNRDL